jgi:hypothetical protein
MTDLTPQAYEITFVVRDVGEIETELTLDDLAHMRESGQYLNLPEDVGDPEANRRVLRTRLAFLLESDGHLVIRDRAGREWVIPARSLVAAHYRAPWDQPSPPLQILKADR